MPICVSDLTPNERQMVLAIVASQYGDTGDPAKAIWSWDVCGTKSKAAVLGSLVKKGVAWQQGRGDDATCGLTPAGQALYAAMTAAPAE